MTLQHELTAYREAVPRLLAEGDRGRYALVHGDRLDSVWETLDQALDAGYERFGREPFLVMQIVEHPADTARTGHADRGGKQG